MLLNEGSNEGSDVVVGCCKREGGLGTITNLACLLSQASPSTGNFEQHPRELHAAGRCVGVAFLCMGNGASAEEQQGADGAPEVDDDGVTCLRDIVYISSGESAVFVDSPWRPPNMKQALDVYKPAAGNPAAERAFRPGRGLPVVVHFHGGGWRRGDRSHPWFGSPSVCTSLARDGGYVVVAPSYRLRNWYHHREDCHSIMTWVHCNVASFGGDPTNVFLSGHSAGANIVSLLVCGGECWMKEELRKGMIKGVIAVSGIYNLFNPFRTSGWLGGVKNAAFHATYVTGSIAAFREPDKEGGGGAVAVLAVCLCNSPSYYIETLIAPGSAGREGPRKLC